MHLLTYLFMLNRCANVIPTMNSMVNVSRMTGVSDYRTVMVVPRKTADRVTRTESGADGVVLKKKWADFLFKQNVGTIFCTKHRIDSFACTHNRPDFMFKQ